MSDVMLHGVLNMPIELWRDDALDKIQRHSRYVEASRLIIELQDRLRAAEAERDSIVELSSARAEKMNKYFSELQKAREQEPIYFWKEIGETDWIECHKTWYEKCQSSPEHDTKLLYTTPVPAQQVRDADEAFNHYIKQFPDLEAAEWVDREADTIWKEGFAAGQAAHKPQSSVPEQFYKWYARLTNQDQVADDGELVGYCCTLEMMSEFEAMLSAAPEVK